MAKLFDDGWWYERTEDNDARFILGQPGEKTLVCFGVNPSTATPEKLDPTLRRVKGLAKLHGYDGWMMFNVYPLRATNPADLPAEWDNLLHAMNRLHIYQTLKKLGAVTVWAAWGTLIEKRPYLALCLREIVADSKCRPLQWITIGDRSQAGHPHHPLYLANEAEITPFDIDEYLAGLK